MNIKYLKLYVKRCEEKGEYPSFGGLKNWHKNILKERTS